MACFSPFTTGSGFSGSDLFPVLAWGIVGAFVAIRRFAREATDEDGSVAHVRRWRRLSTEHGG